MPDESQSSTESRNPIIGHWTIYLEYDGRETVDGSVEYFADGTFAGKTADGSPAKGSWGMTEQGHFRMEYIIDAQPVAKEWTVNYEGSGFTLTGVHERISLRHVPKK